MPITKKQQQKNLKYIIDQEDMIKGKGFIGDIAKKTFQLLANAYRAKNCDGKARQLYSGELHLPCHNFTGPGTRIDITEVRNTKPYNKIDSISKMHDLNYYRASFLSSDKEIRTAIKEADEQYLKDIEPYKSESGYTLAKAGIEGKMALSSAFPLIMEQLLGKKHFGAKLPFTSIKRNNKKYKKD